MHPKGCFSKQIEKYEKQTYFHKVHFNFYKLRFSDYFWNQQPCLFTRLQ